MDYKKVRCDGVDWIYLAQEMEGYSEHDCMKRMWWIACLAERMLHLQQGIFCKDLEKEARTLKDLLYLQSWQW